MVLPVRIELTASALLGHIDTAFAEVKAVLVNAAAGEREPAGASCRRKCLQMPVVRVANRCQRLCATTEKQWWPTFLARKPLVPRFR